jgi:hypothetical protein
MGVLRSLVRTAPTRLVGGLLPADIEASARIALTICDHGSHARRRSRR